MLRDECPPFPPTPVRAPEAIALFNVVLTSELIVNACWSNAQAGGAGIDWPAAFLVLPIALHPPTREQLPKQRRITLARWAVVHPDLVSGMEARVAMLVQPTKRAIRHGLRTGRLAIESSAIVATRRPKSPSSDWPVELATSVRAARLCGDWLNVTETHMAFELLGMGN